MIINKNDKSIQTRSDKPNSNWLDDEWYVVPDNSPLAEKAFELFPQFEIVLDENGEVKDIVEKNKTQEELNEERIEEIHLALEELDKVINRATEDLYVLTKTEPYPTVQEAIAQKGKLRLELQELAKEE